MLPEGAFVPAVSTPPPSETRAAWMSSEPPARLAPAVPRRSRAGEIATPPEALIVSEWPLTQSVAGVVTALELRVGADEDVGGR